MTIARLVLFIAALAATTPTFLPAPVHAESPADLLRGRVLDLLRQPPSTYTAEAWANIGPGGSVRAQLVGILRDADYDARLRARCARALGVMPSREARQVLWQMVYAPGEPDVIRSASLAAIGNAFQGEVLYEIAPFLTDEAEAMRRGAIEALGAIRDTRARSQLEGHLIRETSIDLRLLCEAAVSKHKSWERAEDKRRASEILPGTTRPDGDPMHGVVDR